MVTENDETASSASEYLAARTGDSALLEDSQSSFVDKQQLVACQPTDVAAEETEPEPELANLLHESKKGIHVSNNTKRDQKDRKIYVHPKTGLPVRPPTSFGLFMHTYRRTFKDDKVGFLDFNKRATERWAKMKAEHKAPYVERAKKLSDQYKKVEVFYLRKRVRQLQQQIKEYRKAAKEISRNRY